MKDALAPVKYITRYGVDHSLNQVFLSMVIKMRPYRRNPKANLGKEGTHHWGAVMIPGERRLGQDFYLLHHLCFQS